MGRVGHFVGNTLVPGVAQGEAIVADVQLSFWGGLDPVTGRVIDRRHPLSGLTLTARVLVIPTGRGSCSGSGVLLEAIYNGTAPAAIVLSQADPIICLGAVLGDELYGKHPVIVAVANDVRRQIVSGDFVAIDELGTVTVDR